MRRGWSGGRPPRRNHPRREAKCLKLDQRWPVRPIGSLEDAHDLARGEVDDGTAAGSGDVLLSLRPHLEHLWPVHGLVSLESGKRRGERSVNPDAFVQKDPQGVSRFHGVADLVIEAGNIPRGRRDRLDLRLGLAVNLRGIQREFIVVEIEEQGGRRSAELVK